jgi:hypothetical protein
MHPDAQLKTALKNGFDPKLLYKEPLTTVKEPVCSILEKHSKVPVDKVVSHVNEVVSRMTNPSTTLNYYVLIFSSETAHLQ